MKQKLLSFVFLLCALVAGTSVSRADDITFDFEDSGAYRASGSNSYTSNTYTENGATISLTYADAVTSGSPLGGSANVQGRIAKNTTNSPVVKIGAVDITNKKVTGVAYKTKGVNAMKMVVAYSLDNSTWTNLQTISSMPTSSTDESVSESELDITGSNFYLRFTVTVSTSTGSNRDFQLDDIVITYEEVAAAGTTAAPTISGDTPFLTSTTVTIENAASATGAKIYYTLDGTDPTTSSTLYSNPFTLTETKTVKAIAKADADENASSVVSKTFTKVTPLANIAALTAETESGSYYVTLDDAVVTYANGNYAYIQDASGAVALYKSGHGLTAGQVLDGTATVTYQLHNSNPQITDISGVTPVAGSAPSPTSVAQSAWNYTFSNVLNQYFEITGATITTSGGKYYVELNSESVQLYKASGSISSLDLTKTYTITGFPMFYNSTKELQIFEDPEVEVGSDPTIITVSSLTSFTYEVGNGPSAAQTFTVSGSNLTADISLSLSGSDYEMSLSEGSGYTNSLTLTQTAGEVATTTIYVRLKAGLAANSYDATITLTSTGATDSTVDLTGNVTVPEAPNFTWDLSTNSYKSASTDEVVWESTYATMTANKAGSSTNANNYLPTTRTSSRFYTNSILTIAPASGYAITSIVFTATSTSYASALQGSTWDNATAAVDGSTVTVTPTDGRSAVEATIGGTCGFTAVKVYYATTATVTIAAACTDGAGKYYGTYSNDAAFVVPADLTVSAIGVSEGKLVVTAYSEGDVVKAGTGVMVSATSAGDKTVVLTSETGTEKSGNLLKGSGNSGINAAGMTVADTKFYRLTMHNGTDLGFYWGAASGAAFDLAANKAYLAVPDAVAPVKGFALFGDEETAISAVDDDQNVEKVVYDLSGRRIQKPTKGLYIVNGKKIMVK